MIHASLCSVAYFKEIYDSKHINADNSDDKNHNKHALMELNIYIPELSLTIEYDGDTGIVMRLC